MISSKNRVFSAATTGVRTGVLSGINAHSHISKSSNSIDDGKVFGNASRRSLRRTSPHQQQTATKNSKHEPSVECDPQPQCLGGVQPPPAVGPTCDATHSSNGGHGRDSHCPLLSRAGNCGAGASRLWNRQPPHLNQPSRHIASDLTPALCRGHATTIIDGRGGGRKV